MSTEDALDDDSHDIEGEDEDVKARKRKERLEQNRISARESRKRKKTMIEELQRTVITLSRENKDLNERNENLRRQLMEIGAKYPNIVPLQAIVGQGAATAEGAAAAATAAAAGAAGAAASGGGAAGGTANPLSTLNPVNWMATGGGGNNNNAATGGSGEATDAGADSSNQATV